MTSIYEIRLLMSDEYTTQQIGMFRKIHEVVVSGSIFHPEFNAVFRFSELALFFLWSQRSVVAARREMQCTFLGYYPSTFVTLHYEQRRLNVEIARKREPILKNKKRR
jgi:hypothetical protein